MLNPTNLPAPVQAFFSQAMLAIQVPNLIFNECAEKIAMEANQGLILRRRRYETPQPAITPLGPTGVTPPPANINIVDVDAKIQFYGNYVFVTDQVTLQNQDPVLSELTKVMALNMRETEDQLTRDVLASSAFVVNATNGGNGDNPTEPTITDVQIVIRRMLANNARTLSNIIGGADKFGTGPIRNSWFGLIHSDMATQFEAIPEFLYASNYPNQSNLLESEWGNIANIRFLQSSVGSKSDNASWLGRTVYNNLIVGAQSYMHVLQNRYSASFIYHPPQLSGPLELYSSIGWKMAQASRITNEDWICNFRTTLAQ